MKISKNFSRSEFACKCGCGFATVDVELVGLLEKIRHHFGAAVAISSGCRCKAHNEAIGGKANSKHLQGIAADITVKGVHPNDVHQYLAIEIGDRNGLRYYETFTHIDVRPNRARW